MAVCRLRALREADLDDLVTAANNVNVARNLRSSRFPSPYTREDAERWYAFCSENARSSAPRFWSIATSEEEGDKIVGGIGVTGSPNDPHKAHVQELGYWLGEEYWGRGYATHAVKEVVRKVFTEPAFADCERLEATPYGRNTASQRVLEKAGFVREGVMRRAFENYGQKEDLVVYSLLRDEYLEGGAGGDGEEKQDAAAESKA